MPKMPQLVTGLDWYEKFDAHLVKNRIYVTRCARETVVLFRGEIVKQFRLEDASWVSYVERLDADRAEESLSEAAKYIADGVKDE